MLGIAATGRRYLPTGLLPQPSDDRLAGMWGTMQWASDYLATFKASGVLPPNGVIWDRSLADPDMNLRGAAVG